MEELVKQLRHITALMNEYEKLREMWEYEEREYETEVMECMIREALWEWYHTTRRILFPSIRGD